MKKKKKKKHGFTLIELLAVILILGVIALIAIPVITGIIEDTKKGAAINSTYNYLNEVGVYLQLQEINNYSDRLENNKIYKVSEETVYNVEGDIGSLYLKNIIELKKTNPMDGYIKIENNDIKYALLEMNKYTVECTSSDKCNILGKYKVIDVTEVAINSSNNKKMLGINQTLQLTESLEPSNATVKKVVWSSSDTNIATVDNTGLVTGVSNGTVIITATALNGTAYGTYEVIINPLYEDNKIYLYRDGLINEELTDGFVVHNQTEDPRNIVDFRSNYIYMDSSLSGGFGRRFFSNKKINLTNYSNLHILYQALGQLDYVYNAASILISSQNAICFVPIDKYLEKVGTVPTPTVLTLDISDISSEYYFGFAIGSLTQVSVYEIWLD